MKQTSWSSEADSAIAPTPSRRTRVPRARVAARLGALKGEGKRGIWGFWLEITFLLAANDSLPRREEHKRPKTRFSFRVGRAGEPCPASLCSGRALWGGWTSFLGVAPSGKVRGRFREGLGVGARFGEVGRPRSKGLRVSPIGLPCIPGSGSPIAAASRKPRKLPLTEARSRPPHIGLPCIAASAP